MITDPVSEAFRQLDRSRDVLKSKAASMGGSLLSHSINQITRPTWWNEPTQPWESNRKKRNEAAALRAEFMAALKRKRTPQTMDQLAKEFNCSVAKVRSMAEPFVKSEEIVRGINSEKRVTLERKK